MLTTESSVRYLTLVLLALLTISSRAGAADRPNVLFIAIDDLRPELGTYGTNLKTPNFDRLASSGMRFDRAYCQQAVCGASRLSIMGGLYPTLTKEQTFHVDGWRKRHPNLLTMNQHFTAEGYQTIGLGKIYHNTGGAGVDPDNWSQWIKLSAAHYVLEENVAILDASTSGTAHSSAKGPTTEMADVSDDTYLDGMRARKAAEVLRELSRKNDSPFFLALGLTKPHLPFVAPKKYWDMYNRDNFSMPDNAGIPPGYPDYAANLAAHEMKHYSDYEGEMPTDFSDAMNKRLLHGYAACVSYTDANLGVVLDALDESGLSENTIVVLWGDHGWKLGDHSSWCKHTNFECDTRVPLIVRAPGKQSGKPTNRLVELIDLYPTLCELTGIATPPHCQGRSFANLLDDPHDGHRNAAYSSYPAKKEIGHSIRFGDYRYTQWQLAADGSSTNKRVLTNLKDDPGEVTNVVADPSHAEVLKQAEELLSKRISEAQKSKSTSSNTEVLPDNKPSLRKLVAGRFRMGVGTNFGTLKRPEDIRLLKRHFDIITPESCMKPNAVQKKEGEFNFSKADAMVDFAEANGIEVAGHCLIWTRPGTTPDWFFKDGDRAASKELLLSRLKTHIHTVAGRYKGRIAMWDVVNESLSDVEGEFLRDNEWLNALGEEFLVNAFQFAREADPDALLVYNDYRCAQPRKLERLIRLIKSVKEQGGPIDALGLQSHYEYGAIPYEGLENLLLSMRELGVKVVFSELDMDVVTRGRWYKDSGKHRDEVRKFNPYPDQCPPEVLANQAEQYAKLFSIICKHSDVVERVTFWNLHDGQSWLNNWPWKRTNHPLLFDRNLQEKPAFDAVVNVLASSPAASSEMEGTRPNIVFFLSDDQSKFDHTAYGAKKAPTPTVGKFAKEALVFDRAFTGQAICAPSRSMLYTGLRPIRNGCFINHTEIRPGVQTITHYMKELGYEVILAGKSHVSPPKQFQWTKRFHPVKVDGLPRPRIPIDEIDRFFEKPGDKPFCMIIASEFPHSPHIEDTPFGADDVTLPPFVNATPESRAAYARYYASIMEKENEFNDVLKSLEKHGLSEDAVVFYADDHGSQRGKYTVYDTGLNVACMVRWPGRIATGRTDALVSFADFLPTAIELAGGKVLDNLDGKSLLPLLEGKTNKHHDYVYGVSTRQGIQRRCIFPSRSVHDGKYHYIFNFNSMERLKRDRTAGIEIDFFREDGAKKFKAVPEEELYDTGNDPYELTNVVNRQTLAAVKARLKRELLRHMESQNDFLSENGALPILEVKQHELDESDAKYDYHIPADLEGSLKGRKRDPHLITSQKRTNHDS